MRWICNQQTLIGGIAGVPPPSAVLMCLCLALILQAALDALDCNKRFIDYPWKVWGNPEEGGAAKPSKVLAGGPQAAVAAGDA